MSTSLTPKVASKKKVNFNLSKKQATVKSPRTNQVPVSQISLERKNKVSGSNILQQFKSLPQVSNNNLPIDQRFVNSKFGSPRLLKKFKKEQNQLV